MKRFKCMIMAVVATVATVCGGGQETGCTNAATNAVFRVGTCNVRVWSKKDLAEGNVWDERKDDLIALSATIELPTNKTH